MAIDDTERYHPYTNIDMIISSDFLNTVKRGGYICRNIYTTEIFLNHKI